MLGVHLFKQVRLFGNLRYVKSKMAVLQSNGILFVHSVRMIALSSFEVMVLKVILTLLYSVTLKFKMAEFNMPQQIHASTSNHTLTVPVTHESLSSSGIEVT